MSKYQIPPYFGHHSSCRLRQLIEAFIFQNKLQENGRPVCHPARQLRHRDVVGRKQKGLYPRSAEKYETGPRRCHFEPRNWFRMRTCRRGHAQRHILCGWSCMHRRGKRYDEGGLPPLSFISLLSRTLCLASLYGTTANNRAEWTMTAPPSFRPSC